MSLGTKSLREDEAPSEPVHLAPVGADDLPLTVIERKPGWHFFDTHELWRYRELLVFLIWRDLKVRYKQTVLGVLWAVLQPLAIMIAFSLFFHRLADLRSGGAPYPLYVLTGLIPWIFFANAISTAGQSIVGNQELVTKLYFPRVIIPMASVMAALVDFVIAFGMLLITIPLFGWSYTWKLLYIPPFMALLAITAMGVGALLAALTVAYRDFRHVVPFLVQLWMFATPTIYIKEYIDLKDVNLRLLLPLNPADGLITSFRTAALGLPFEEEALYALILSSLVGFLVFVAGCLYFRRVERSFADII